MAHKIERVMENTLVVGIDIAKRTHWAQMTDSRGVPLCKPQKVDNSADGFSSLSEKIKALCLEHSFTTVMLGFEPSGHYWRTLAWHFKTEDVCLLGVNPYHVKQLKELEDNAQTKSDKKDALVIAHLIRDGRYFDVYMPEEQYADLRILRRHRDQLADRRKWAMNHIVAVLDEYFPEYETIGFHVGTISARAILRAALFPSDLRCIIYIIGDKGMLVSPEMQMYYQYLRHRPVNQLKHQQAVLAVGLKLMRIMFHVVKYKEYYDPAKSLGEERLSQIRSVA